MFGGGVVPITIEDIKSKTKEIVEWSADYPERQGCLLLRPKVKLIHKPTECYMHVQVIDVNGSNPGTVCIRGEYYCIWVPIGEFDFPAST